MSAWSAVVLGEAVTLINGDRGRNYPSAAHRTGSGIPFINAGLLVNGRVRPSGDNYISQEQYDLLRSGRIASGDVLLCIRGSIGRVALVTPEVVPGAVASSLVILRPKANVNPIFLLALLQSPAGQELITASDNGVAQPNVGSSEVARFRLVMPDRPTQDRIAHVLAALDDLIENHRRRVQVLEDLAKAIYREWFVRFRFPGSEPVPGVESASGAIPKGWEERQLVDVAHITMGQSPPSQFYNEDGIGTPFHQGVTDFGGDFPVDRKFCTAEGRRAHGGDILVSVRAPVGRINVALHDSVIGRGVAAVRSRTGHQTLLFRALRDSVFAEEDSMGGGTIFKAIGKSELERVTIIVPPMELADYAERALAANLDMIKTLTLQARLLVRIRDLLLPRLVSGQIDESTLDLASLAEATA